MLSVKDCLKEFEKTPQNNDRLGEISNGTKMFAPNLQDAQGFKMLKEINLTTERTNPSYIAWIKNRLRNVMIESYSGKEQDVDDEIDERKKRKDKEFLKNYLKTYDPNLTNNPKNSKEPNLTQT